MKFQALLCVLVALVAATFATTITDVKNDLQSLNTQSEGVLQRLYNMLSGIPQSLVSASNKFVGSIPAIKGLQGLMTQSDGLDIQTGLNTLRSTVSQIENNLGTNADGGLGDELPQAMQNLKSNFAAYEAALQAKAPAGLQL